MTQAEIRRLIRLIADEEPRPTPCECKCKCKCGKREK